MPNLNCNINDLKFPRMQLARSIDRLIDRSNDQSNGSIGSIDHYKMLIVDKMIHYFYAQKGKNRSMGRFSPSRK